MNIYRKSLKFMVGALIAGVIVSACGGGSDDPYAPSEISKEHQGLSVSELKAIASDISYKELIGHPGEGIFFDITNPKLMENIEKHTGTLTYSQGFVEVVYPSKDKSRVTIWLCPQSENTDASEDDDVEEFNCREAVFLLYGVNRGPALTKADVVEVAGVIVGGQKKETNRGSQDRVLFTGNSTTYHPKVSVIKAERLGVSDWQPDMKKR